MINRLIHSTTILHNAYINKNRKHRYQIKVISLNSISFLFYTIIYTNLHIKDDSLVPVLRNKAF